MSSVGQPRPKAEGFPRAPLIEALIDVQFEVPLADIELERAREALKGSYPTFTPQPFHQFRIDAEAESVQILGARTHFQGRSEDPSEICLLRPEGLATSQLAPYRDWASLNGRFTRDLGLIEGAIGPRPLSRIAVRNINRIDVPPTENVVRYEDYITVHPNLPAALDPIMDFQIQVLRQVPEIDSLVHIIVKGHPEAVAGRASFIVDIDIFRTIDIPADREQLQELLQQFRSAKNTIYRTCLTPRALKEFEE